jgi:hypothetical protein
MPRKCIRRSGSGNLQGSWTEENLREAIKRIGTNVIGVNVASSYYGIPSRTLRCKEQPGILAKLPFDPQDVFSIQKRKRSVEHIQLL